MQSRIYSSSCFGGKSDSIGSSSVPIASGSIGLVDLVFSALSVPVKAAVSRSKSSAAVDVAFKAEDDEVGGRGGRGGFLLIKRRTYSISSMFSLRAYRHL